MCLLKMCVDAWWSLCARYKLVSRVCRPICFLTSRQHYLTVASLLWVQATTPRCASPRRRCPKCNNSSNRAGVSAHRSLNPSTRVRCPQCVYCASTYFASQCARFAESKQHVHCPASLTYTHLRLCAHPFTHRYGLRQPSPAGREGDGGGRLPGGQGEDRHADGQEERRHQAAPFVRGEWQAVWFCYCGCMG
jgi:hypothetical protein